MAETLTVGGRPNGIGQGKLLGQKAQPAPWAAKTDLADTLPEKYIIQLQARCRGQGYRRRTFREKRDRRVVNALASVVADLGGDASGVVAAASGLSDGSSQRNKTAPRVAPASTVHLAADAVLKSPNAPEKGLAKGKGSLVFELLRQKPMAAKTESSSTAADVKDAVDAPKRTELAKCSSAKHPLRRLHACFCTALAGARRGVRLRSLLRGKRCGADDLCAARGATPEKFVMNVSEAGPELQRVRVLLGEVERYLLAAEDAEPPFQLRDLVSVVSTANCYPDVVGMVVKLHGKMATIVDSKRHKFDVKVTDLRPAASEEDRFNEARNVPSPKQLLARPDSSSCDPLLVLSSASDYSKLAEGFSDICLKFDLLKPKHVEELSRPIALVSESWLHLERAVVALDYLLTRVAGGEAVRPRTIDKRTIPRKGDFERCLHGLQKAKLLLLEYEKLLRGPPHCSGRKSHCPAWNQVLSLRPLPRGILRTDGVGLSDIQPGKTTVYYRSDGGCQ